MLWIGLISGTSADAVDAALVRIGPTPRDAELLAYLEVPLEESLRGRIHGLAQGRAALRDLVALDVTLGERFAEAALAVARKGGASPGEIEGIGSHGQTVGHYPEPEVRGTLQIGSAAVIHACTGIPVVSDFRSADMAAGGQGAPLTPFAHHVLFARDDEPRAVLNVGGFTNLSHLPDANPERVVAFDPGPGNALLDRAARAASEGTQRFDADGAGARRGRVHSELLATLLDDPYFAMSPPKSTGHEHFDAGFFERARTAVENGGGSPEDLLATLVELTVESVARSAERFLSGTPRRWLVYGGGVRNGHLMERLAARLAPASVDVLDRHGVAAESFEALSFALLGWCAARGHPSNLPAATGAREAVVLGSVTPPAAFRP